MKIKRFNEFIYENKQLLLAPNGKPSNLNEFQYNQVRTQEFIEWFGDWINDPLNSSKVLDDNGEPLVVYHGSPSIFNTFRPSVKIGTHGESDQIEGIYFTDSKDGADFYTPNDDQRYMKCVYLCIKNPFLSDNIKNLKNSLNTELLGDVSDIIRDKGNDGLIVESGFYSNGGPWKMFITYESNQIKSAIGNNGNFNKNNTNINENKAV